MGRFIWHPKARLWTDAGPRALPDDPICDGRIPPAPAEHAIAAVFAAAKTGQPFCITDSDAPLPAAGLDLFFCQTGGSTGAPKRIARSMDSWIASFTHNAALFELGPADHYACLGPLNHSLNLYAATEAGHLGADLSLLQDHRPDAQLDAMAARGATVIYATPTNLHMLASAARRLGQTLPAVRYLFVGGADLPHSTAQLLTQMAPHAALRVFYGAAETSFITMAGADTPAGSVGRPYGGVRLELRDAQGALCAAGQEGAIWVQSPYAFDHYASGHNPHFIRDGDWISLGERGVLDDRGQLFLRGRAERMFQIAGENVYPETIEAFLLAVPGITHAAVLPRPDATRGAVAVAAIKTGPDGDALDQDVLLSQLRSGFGPMIAPRALYVLTDWPQLPSGKTDYSALDGMLPK
jgi:long-chain acyl-CoA synthetase